MSTLSPPLPLALRLGLNHVSVAELSTGWAAILWSAKTGQHHTLCSGRSCEGAVDHARGYAELAADRICDLPDGLGEASGRGVVHIDRNDEGQIEVSQWSASRNTGVTLRHFEHHELRHFEHHEKGRAVQFALDSLTTYHNGRGQASRLGRVAI